MASRYGFRVFTLTASRRGEPEFLDLSPERSTWPDALETAFTLLHADGTQYGTPQLRVTAPLADPDRPQLPDPSLSVEQPVRVTDHHLHVSISTGYVGLHKQFVKPADAALSLDDGSAEVEHRLDFFFPKDEGGTALLVMETVNGADAKDRVRRYMVDAIRRMNDAAKAANAEARKKAKAERTEIPKKVQALRPTWTIRQVADGHHLSAMISRAKEAAVTFEEYVVSDRGSGDQQRRRGRVTISLFTEQERDTAIARVRGWLRMRDEPPSRHDVLVELADDFHVDTDALATSNIHVNRASLTIAAEDGETRTLTPDSIKEFFTYPVSSGHPSMSHYYGKVIPKVEDLADQHEIEMAYVDPEEVAACLTDLTPGPSRGA